MPRTHRRTWQRSEGRAAALFGCCRQVGSGSAGRGDVTASDSTHPVLFVESKLRDRHTTRTLHDATKKRAAKERRYRCWRFLTSKGTAVSSLFIATIS